MNDRVVILSVAQEPAFGAERVLAHLVRGLPRTSAARTILLRPDGSGLARWTEQAPITAQQWTARSDKTSRNLPAAFRAARALRHQQIGIVHAWGVRAFEPALLLARLLHARVAGTLHDHPRAIFFGPARRWLFRVSAPRLQPMVCVSEALAAACRDVGPAAQLAVIRNGLPPQDAPGVPRDPAAGDRLRVGFFGMYARWKGFELVREWIGKAGPNIEWHLYGDPAPELRAACGELQAQQLPNVVFHGWVDNAGAMDGIDVLVHTSIAFDPYPTVLLEAARAGIPALASDLGGAREIVADGVTGLLFSPSDPDGGYRHLMTLAADLNRRERMGEAARRRFAAEFRIEPMVDAYRALWHATGG